MDIHLGIGVLQNRPPEDLIRFAQWCESLGYQHFWYANEKFYRDMYVGLTLCAVHTKRMRLGTFVADPYTQHPALTAIAIASLDEACHGRAMLAIGASGAAGAPLGHQRIKPARAIGEAVVLIRSLLKGGPVDFEGDVVKFRGGQLSFPARPDIPLYVASRGDLVLSKGGEVADGVMIATYATPPGIRHALSRVGVGLKRAGRRLADLELFARVDCAVSADPREALEAVRPMVARMLGSSYPDRSFVHALGFALPPAFEEVVRQRNHALTSAAAHLLPDEVVRAYAWVGTADQVAAQAAAVVDLGIRNITFLAHAPKNGSVDGTVQAFATEVKPRVEALLKG